MHSAVKVLGNGSASVQPGDEAGFLQRPGQEHASPTGRYHAHALNRGAECEHILEVGREELGAPEQAGVGFTLCNSSADVIKPRPEDVAVAEQGKATR